MRMPAMPNSVITTSITSTISKVAPPLPVDRASHDSLRELGLTMRTTEL
jgi:hypothetical protein